MARPRHTTKPRAEPPRAVQSSVLGGSWLARRAPFKPRPPVPLPGEGLAPDPAEWQKPAPSQSRRALAPMTIVIVAMVAVAFHSNVWQSNLAQDGGSQVGVTQITRWRTEDRRDPEWSMAPAPVETAGVNAPFSLQGGWRDLDTAAIQDRIAPPLATPADQAPTVPAEVDRGVEPEATVARSVISPITNDAAAGAVAPAPTTPIRESAAVETLAASRPPVDTTAAALEAAPSWAADHTPLRPEPDQAAVMLSPAPVASQPTAAVEASSDHASDAVSAPTTPTVAEHALASAPPKASETRIDGTRAPDLVAAPSGADRLRLPRRKPDWIVQMALSRSAAARQARVRPIRSASAPPPTKAAKPDVELPLTTSFGGLQHRAP